MPEPTTERGTFRWHRDADSVVTVALSLAPDDPDAAADLLTRVTDRLAAEIADAGSGETGRTAGTAESADAGTATGTAGPVRGVVLEFGGVEFFSGAPLAGLTGPRPPDARTIQDTSLRLKGALRRLETLGPPVVAALTGSALGGGLEIALACHHRIVLDRPRTRLGLPEVTLGLVPAGGGVVRCVRLLGLVDALQQVLLEGRRLSPERALAAGLVHRVVRSPDELAHQARAFIDGLAGSGGRGGPAGPGDGAGPAEGRQPWDAPGYRIPGGAPADPDMAAVLPSFPALLRRRTGGAPYPAPRDILAAAVEGAQVDLATAERIEARYAARTATGPVARNMTRAARIDLPAVNAGRSRPRDVPTRAAARVAVLGAGMMGAGIAHACAAAGVEVVLKDVDEAAARRGRERAAQPLDRAVARGRLSADRRAAILDRITPTARPEDLAGCDVVIEAVFEDSELKQKVFQEVQDVVAPDALLCSNTSTLPVSRLAEGVTRVEDFVGLHFFSPVDRMPLVEVVRGERTGDAALARAFDLVRQLGKTPIVVNDARGFFTSRVIGCRLNEGAAMVGEGVEPASVEQASARAGYPTGVLALLDEVTLTLGRRIRDESRAAAEAAGQPWRPHPAEAVIDRMIDAFDRPGRAAGAGFYDYPEGRRAGLWPGLREHFTDPAVRPPLPDLSDRLLFSEALEAVRLLDRGVVTSVADANVGSLLGLGFPAWTGGVLQFVEGRPGGLAGFVARARELADRYGPRFAPPEALVARAERGAGLADPG